MTKPLTQQELIEAIRRNKVNAADTRFDEQMRGMFRKVVRARERQLADLMEQAA